MSENPTDERYNDIFLVFFGGKGGVGKSTTSAATAVHLAKLNPDKRILLISFDMAHNLSDLFDTVIGDQITQIMPNLHAIEPDAERYTEEFVADFVEKAKILAYSLPIVKKLTNLEAYIDESFSAASIPLAVKNSIFFEEIVTKADQFDLFIVDMPPTGNMISIFEVPKTSMQVILKQTLETMDKLMDFIRKIRKINPINWFRSPSEEQKNTAREMLHMLKELDKRGDLIVRLMKDNSSLRFVSIAERPSFEEIRRAKLITDKYVKLDGVIINRINPPSCRCECCELESKNQEKYVRLIEEEFSDQKIWKGQKMMDEVIGIERLVDFANMIYGDQSFEEILHPRGNGDVSS
ncbi:MAG: ArsA family ATPase [Promethearchaeota archaeon]